MRRTIVVGLLTAGVHLAALNPAFAQDIVKLNEDGITAFSEGRFEEAAQKFNQAYALKPEAPLKKNEAVAWFKAQKCPEALAAAKEYLALPVENELSTREAQTVAVRCHITQAEAALAAGNPDSASTALAGAQANSPTEEDAQTIARLQGDVKAKRDAVEAERQFAAQAAAADEAREAREAKRQTTHVLGLGVAGAGGAIVVGTLIYHLALATGTAPKFKDASAAGDREQYEKLGKRLETGNWLVPTLYAVGLATTGLGVYLWWSTAPESAPASASKGGLESLGATATWTF